MKEEALQELEQQLAKCRECKLCEFAKGPVGWFGCAETPIEFVGEGPGGVEDDYGCPLIGPSGAAFGQSFVGNQNDKGQGDYN